MTPNTPTVVSVIVPTLNEYTTIGTLLRSLFALQIPDVKLQIIVVDSYSTDGTYEILLLLAQQFDFLIVGFVPPYGKGLAVKMGLSYAKGDIIMIQDGDLEYDINDYQKLLRPILDGEADVVLGSRHNGEEAMRNFKNQKMLTMFMNFGHWFFTKLFNILFRTNLHDPFTMYKIFRRSCLKHCMFKCNRFDFDIELLVTLIRNGYKPLEIPISYQSRSFKQGKKIRIFYDPITWIWTLIRLWLQ